MTSSFFDLNIPYTETTNHNSPTAKSTRLKLTIKALELGYTAIAYNRTLTTPMTDNDRCSISLFPLSSILKLSPSISTAVTLHRRLLNVSVTSPFRQYTRLTVVVDSPAQGACLNSGNPVLKSYDVVAVRPLRQESFDLACRNYEVDIIAVDFSETRFRLKQPLVKAAIQRGVCFEITYSGLLVDAQLRRQMISNVKLLVDWTRGKNLILSSAAASVTEFRGPYDVANLACLLGFSLERAKASVSKTCRTLLENSLRKKKFFKEAIRVELISSTDDGFDDWLKWDPISSGEGDLQLDDMAKSFAASNNESKTNKAIDFVSVMNDLSSSHGLQINNMVTKTKLDSKLPESHEKGALLNFGSYNISSANENLGTLVSIEADEACAMVIEETEQQVLPKEVYADIDIREDNENLESGNFDLSSANKNLGTCAMIIEESEQQKLQIKNDQEMLEENIIDDKDSENICDDVSKPENLVSFVDIRSDACLPQEVLEEHTSDTKDVAVTPVSSCIPSSDVSLNEDMIKEHINVMEENASTAPSGALATTRSYDELQINGCNSVVHEPSEDVSTTPSASASLAVLRSDDDLQINGCNLVDHEPLEDVSMGVNIEVNGDSHMNHLNAQNSSSDRVRRNHRSSRLSVSFPFKRWLKASHFKKTLNGKRRSRIL